MGRTTSYNIIISPELWSKVSKQNKNLLDDFLAYKKSSDKSPNTIHQYFQVLRIFFVWNYSNNDNKFFVDIKKRDYVRFFNYLVTDLKSSPNRIITVKSILSSLCNYIENILDDEYPTYKNNVKNIETVAKQPVREKTIIEQKDLERLLKKLIKEKKFQTACYVALAAASGSRKSELLRFKCDYFKPENIVFGCLYKTPEKVVTKGKGSRGKLLYKYTFVNQFKPYFDLWMKEREKLGIDNEYLFVVKRDGKWEQASIHNANSWARMITQTTGIEFYFHSLRHLWTTELKRKNLPDMVIQQLQGWASADMINVYSDLDIEDVLGNYFDENGVKEDIKVAKLTDI